ncbi:MAG TPA: hypothetical protein VEI06_12755 [Gemmatimonadaceae bacterium]|nr:hypothetical protein [Gemmatimonadaceae bacterium]
MTTDQELRDAYQLVAGRSAAVPCPAPERIAALAAGEGSETERLATLEHAMQCAMCRKELDLLRAAAQGAEEAAPARTFLPRWAALAASVLIALGVGALAWRVIPRAPGADVLRGGAPTFAIVQPAADARVTPPVALRWRSVPGATSYTVELLSGAGGLVSSWTTSDTSAAVPDSVHLDSGATYGAWVRAELPNRVEISSPVERFTVR